MRFAALLILLAACGENAAPTVDDIRVSNPMVQRFTPFYVTLVGVEDPDGNVYDGLVRVKASGEDESLSGEVVPFEDEPNRSRGDVIFAAILSGDLPLGAWKIEVIYQDEQGAEAPPMTADLTLTR